MDDILHDGLMMRLKHRHHCCKFIGVTKFIVNLVLIRAFPFRMVLATNVALVFVARCSFATPARHPFRLPLLFSDASFHRGFTDIFKFELASNFIVAKPTVITIE